MRVSLGCKSVEINIFDVQYDTFQSKKSFMKKTFFFLLCPLVVHDFDDKSMSLLNVVGNAFVLS